MSICLILFGMVRRQLLRYPRLPNDLLACTPGWVTASAEGVHPDNVTGNAIRMRKSLLSSQAGSDSCLLSEQLLSPRDALL